jgi:hypothetical protein
MACNCHGKKGEKINGKANPTDQCTACAYKHVNNAKSAWGEFTYTEDNRSFCSGQLRLASLHLMYDHTETALKCRDLAIIIEENKDKDISDVATQLSELLPEVRGHYYADHPDALERLEKLKTSAS